VSLVLHLSHSGIASWRFRGLRARPCGRFVSFVAIPHVPVT
jgi:hypothetical protein